MAAVQQASARWKIARIPGEAERNSTTVNVIAAKIDTKIANSLVRDLNSKAPLPLLGHVKRIKRLQKEGTLELSLILCTADGSDMEILLPTLISEIVTRYSLEPFMAAVAERPARNREEWEMQCRLWPTSYHPNSGKSLEDLGLGQAEVDTMCYFMEIAVEQARLSHQRGQLANGAIIVDPALGTVIAKSHDRTSAWSPLSYNGSHSSPGLQNQEKPEVTLVDGWHPLQHAVMAAIQLVAERDIRLWPAEDANTAEQKREGGNCSPVASNKRQRIFEDVKVKFGCTKNNAGSLDIPRNQEVAQEKPELEIARPYLCTDFDLYVTREPCAMCAMAMVHQRFRRVIYGIPNERNGALGSLYKLHGLPSLNHHYSVFQVSLQEADLL